MVFEALVLFWLGAALGSFLNVVIMRYPDKGPRRSRCIACKRQLRWQELIPIVSFIGLRGRCRRCHAPLSLQYPIVELLMGLATMAIGLPLPTTINDLTTDILIVIILSALVMLFFIDLRLFLLPDSMILTALVASVLMRIVERESIGALLWGAAAGTGMVLLVWLLTAGRGIGLGDVKIMAPLGVLLGPSTTIIMLLLAFTGGAIVGLYLLATHRATLKTPLPFGPYLIAATGIVTLIPQAPAYILELII